MNAQRLAEKERRHECECCERSVAADDYYSIESCNDRGIGVTLCGACCKFSESLLARRASVGPQHPTQPAVLDGRGVLRFKVNRIVRWLLDAGPFDMNVIAVTPFDNEDRRQFAQLLGYSVDGYQDLSYSTPIDDEGPS